MSDFAGTLTVKAPSATAANNAAGNIVTVQSCTYLSHGPVLLNGTTAQNDLIVVSPLWAQGIAKIVHNAPKTAGEAWTAGQKVYLITATNIYTTTSTANQLAGVAAADAASAATVGEVIPGSPF